MLNDDAEVALLILSARVVLSPGESEGLEEMLARPLRWERVLALAAHHGLEALLYHHLHVAGFAGVPVEVVESLRAESKLIAGRSLKLAAKLSVVSAHLQGRGVEHIVYKGPLLAEQYYGNCALRAYRDLDLLVPQDQVVAARDALGEIGFNDKSRLSASAQAASVRFGFEHPFSAAGGFDLDLHWRVVQKFKAPSLDMAGIWERERMVPFWGGEVPAFCPEDLAIALCLHAGHHGWMQLSQMCDLAQVLRAHPGMDWSIFSSHLGDSNTARIAGVSLYLLEQHWGMEIPEAMMARITADPHVPRLARRIQTEIWTSTNPALNTFSFRWLLDRSSGEKLADRIRLILGSIFCPAVEDFEAFRLPLVLSPLYPGLRMLRLAYKYVQTVLRALAKKP